MIRVFCFLTLFFTSFWGWSQEIPSLSFEELHQKIRVDNKDQVKVINFWATWCKPCIEELPYFEALSQTYQDGSVKVLLVSLDMEVDRAVAFKHKKGLQAEVVYLDEVDQNAFIDRISPEWSGAIPATLIVLPDGTEKFYEKKFSSQEELNQTINHLLQLN